MANVNVTYDEMRSAADRLGETYSEFASHTTDTINSSLDGSLVDAWIESGQKTLREASWLVDGPCFSSVPCL